MTPTPWADLVEAVARLAAAARRVREAIGPGPGDGAGAAEALAAAAGGLDRVLARCARADPRGEGLEVQAAVRATAAARDEIGRALEALENEPNSKET